MSEDLSQHHPKKEKYSVFFERTTVAAAFIITILELAYLAYVYIFG